MPSSRYKYFRNAIIKRSFFAKPELWQQDTQREQNKPRGGQANIEAMTQLLHMQQSQHFLSCVVIVIPDNTFKYLLQCYLADDNEIAGKCT